MAQKRQKRKTIKKKTEVEDSQKELIIKTKSDWIKKGLVNKKSYEKNIMIQLKITMLSGKKKEKELLGLNLIQKLKMSNTVNQMFT